MNETLKEALKKAFRTFIQAAIGFIVANLAVTNTSIAEKGGYMKYTVPTLICSAVAFGLSAVMNMPKKGKMKCKITKGEDGGDQYTCEAEDTEKEGEDTDGE